MRDAQRLAMHAIAVNAAMLGFAALTANLRS